jgi:thiol-disulfide isomerase/thioredoxin
MRLIDMRFAGAAVAVSALLVALQPASAQMPSQQQAVPGTPSACIQAGNEYLQSAYDFARRADPTKPPDINALRRAAVALDSACATRFDVATIEPRRASDLAALYLAVGERRQADRAFARAFGPGGLRDTARANAMIGAMAAYIQTGSPTDTAATRTRLEQLAAGVDSISGAQLQRFLARAQLLSFFEDADAEGDAMRVARQMLALAPHLSSADAQRYAAVVVIPYVRLAARYGDHLRADSALAILRRATKEVPALASARPRDRARLDDAIARYELVGKPAPPLHAYQWVNGPGSARNPGATLLVFTAWWCSDCVASYPFLHALEHDLGPKGLHLVFAVNLEGRFRGVPMEPAQEVDANAHYFQDERGFSCPIAFEPRDTNDPAAPSLAADSSNARNYLVFGYPQFTLIDQRGIVRAVIVGWVSSHARDKVIRPAVEQVLASEKTAS